MSGDYFIIDRKHGPFELKEKSSRFLAFLFPVENAADAEKRLESLKKEYHDASHIPFAFRLGKGEEKTFRYSDDGEPGGTGGLPVYQEIARAELFDVLLAVIRYFGGTKLGTGNLKRAFSKCARGLLSSIQLIRVHPRREVTLAVPFTWIGEAMQLINIYEACILSQDYTPLGVRMRLLIPLENAVPFQESLAERSAGNLSLEM